MKVGDLVLHKQKLSSEAGLVVDIIQKKVWRAHDRGKAVNWDLVEPEPHAVVLWSHNDGTVNIPFTELVALNA